LPRCQVPNFTATGQPGNPATKQKAPRRNRRGAKSKNEFELAGYLAFFTLVASDPKSIQREANVGWERLFVKSSDAYSATATFPISQAHTNGFDLVPVDGRESSTLYLVEQSSAADLVIYSYNGGALFIEANPLAPAPNLIFGLFAPIGGQLGSTRKLDCGFTFVHNAVLKNGRCGSLPSRTVMFRFAPASWWRIVLGNPVFATPPRVDTGLIDDPTGATMYAYPSIAVNKLGAALIGYSVFNASTYPSAGYSYIDPFNGLSTPALLKTGDAPSVISRWADFSTTVVDANDIDFWTTQTYSPLLTSGVWATWWARIEMPVPARQRAVRR
jgi:hypothetical protein